MTWVRAGPLATSLAARSSFGEQVDTKSHARKFGEGLLESRVLLFLGGGPETKVGARRATMALDSLNDGGQGGM
jgi:hypothetical protein